VPYTRTSLLGSYGQALRHLDAVGRLTRPAAVAPVAVQP
jgi:hypothetical protein